MSAADALHTAGMAHDECHRLRVLAVDDNFINLSVLTRLLSKHFSHVLDGAPVAVDSGLKALQLLQDNVFDVIFMDIQMPFISGVDCTERIRQGADDVLHANKSAHIVAVTTAVGDEPEILYRRKGFDGLIGKPVDYEALSQLLYPLSSAATMAVRDDRAHLPTVEVLGTKAFAPLPPLDDTIQRERLFYKHVDCVPEALHIAPQIAHSSNFEELLKEQTLLSLRRYGPKAMAMTQRSPFGVSDRRRLRQYDGADSSAASSSPSLSTYSSFDVEGVTDVSLALSAPSDFWTAPCSPNSKSVDESFSQAPRLRSKTRSTRQESPTISQSVFHAQLQREMEAASITVHRKRAQRPALQRASMSTLSLRPYLRSSVEHNDEPHSPADEWHIYANRDEDSDQPHLTSAGSLALFRCSSAAPSVPSSSDDSPGSAGSFGFAKLRSHSMSTDNDDASSAVITLDLDGDTRPFCSSNDNSWLRYSWAPRKKCPTVAGNNATVAIDKLSKMSGPLNERMRSTSVS